MQAADGAIVHLELAVKFYLGRADLHNPQQHCSDPQHWWGIDTRDTLAHKLARLTGINCRSVSACQSWPPIARFRCPKSRPPGCKAVCSPRWISQSRCQQADWHRPSPCTGVPCTH